MISAKIRKELTEAMRARDSLKMNTLRGLLSAFVNELVAKGIKPQEAISDADALNVIKRAVKQRKDSIEQFRKGGREDLSQKEEQELKILETYMPAQISREQIEIIAKQVKEKLAKTAGGGSPDAAQATPGVRSDALGSTAFRGKLIGAVMKETKGGADGSLVKKVVESLM